MGKQEEANRISLEIDFYWEAVELESKADEFKQKGQFDEAVVFYKECEVYVKESNINWLVDDFLPRIIRSYREMKKPEEAAAADRLLQELNANRVHSGM